MLTALCPVRLCMEMHPRHKELLVILPAGILLQEEWFGISLKTEPARKGC